MSVRPQGLPWGRVLMSRTRDPSPALQAYAQAARRRGMSLRTALACYRAAGGRVRTQTFVRAWQAAAADGGRPDSDG
jgi:hypothetical protein